MLVANPIYDVVFKYLLEDIRVAKLIIENLTGFEIEDLVFRPTEYTLSEKTLQDFTVYRLDFSARIKTPNGSKLILIEIQKAKFPTDIMRFRRYLGNQYADPKNAEIVEDEKGNTRKIADPIFCIYFLGHSLENCDAPIVKVKRSTYDIVTGEQLECHSEFIESLTHDCVIVQIPKLKEQRRNKLEVLLSIFNQKFQVDSDAHVLDLNAEFYPKEFQVIIRRLLQANSESEIRKTMIIEDEIIAELEQRDRRIASLDERMNKMIYEKAKVEAEKQQAEAEKQRAEAEKQRAEAEKQRAEAEKQQAEAEKQRAEAAKKQADEQNQKLIELLRSTGMSDAEISKKLSQN